MTLAGRPLELPRYHATGWKDGQTFTEKDDPDRTQKAWDLPTNLLKKNPKQRCMLTSCEELPIPTGSFSRVVHGVFDEEDCAEIIARVNEKGFTQALINIGNGDQMLELQARSGYRVIVDCPELSNWILEVLKPHLPGELQGCKLVDLNERCRFLCYSPGQEFARHRDGRYRRPAGHPHAGDFSKVTVQLYLHDVDPTCGGATTFHLANQDLPCQPRARSVLLFSQDLLHSGSLVTGGVKYTFRTEAMYRA